MTSEFQKASRFTSASNKINQSSVLNTSTFPRRSFLKKGTASSTLLASLYKWALPIGATAAVGGTAAVLARGTATTPSMSSTSFKYQLEKSQPLVYAGGMRKAATVATIPELSGLAIVSLSINAGAMEEVHWHPNVGEMGYILKGQGEVGVFVPGSQPSIFSIQPGSIFFIPTGAAHYISNTGQETLHIINGLSNENPLRIDFSDTIGYIPRSLLAQDFGLPTQSFPFLPQQPDQFLVKASPLSAVNTSSSPYVININDISPATYKGGQLTTVSSQVLPVLDGISVTQVRAQPFALREPHWHPNAAQFSYLIQGTAQVEIMGPNGQRQSFEASAGDVVYVPTSYLQYFASVSDQPMIFISFLSNNQPSRIDFSQIMNAFPHDRIAASFGANRHIFDNIPNLGDVNLAAKSW